MDAMGTKPLTRESSTAWQMHRFSPWVVMIAVSLGLLGSFALTSHIHQASMFKVAGKVLWKNATVRPPLLIVIIVAGWAWVVRVCRASAMNLEHVLGGALQSPIATYHAALVLFSLLVAMHTVHIVASETPGLTWRPWLTCNLILHCIFLFTAITPLRVFHAESRLSLLRTLLESVVAPFAPVTFWHVIVADYMTSVAKAMSDLQLTCCISSHIFYRDHVEPGLYTRTTELWDGFHEHCGDSYSNAIMLALPFWWRLMQCLKVYSQTKEQKNLWNALKYSTAFPLVYAGYVRRHSPSELNDRLFVLAAIVQSSYTFIWDVLMDWGLPQRAKGEKSSSCCGYQLRDPLLVTRNKLVYIGLCIMNLSLRFAWTLSIFGHVKGRGAGMFFFEVIEILRRTVWAVFRIEWEVVCKVYGASHETKHLTSIDSEGSDDMQALEGSKDIED